LIVQPFIKRLNQNALVFAMSAHVIDIAGEARVTIVSSNSWPNAYRSSSSKSLLYSSRGLFRARSLSAVLVSSAKCPASSKSTSAFGTAGLPIAWRRQADRTFKAEQAPKTSEDGFGRSTKFAGSTPACGKT
jgi:hypothetical protein